MVEKEMGSLREQSEKETVKERLSKHLSSRGEVFMPKFIPSQEQPYKLHNAGNDNSVKYEMVQTHHSINYHTHNDYKP